jgi:hypothetical protein
MPSIFLKDRFPFFQPKDVPKRVVTFETTPKELREIRRNLNKKKRRAINALKWALNWTLVSLAVVSLYRVIAYAGGKRFQ